MKILFGVTSSIAIYKALEIISSLKKKEHEIKVIMTENATKMVSTIPFYTLSGNPVAYDTFEKKDNIPHISLSDWADLLVVVPATANIIGKMASGIADDLLSTTLISFNKKIIMAPAMNVKMFDHPMVQNNIKTLKKIGIHFIDPDTGLLACGYEGKGKLAPVDRIIKIIESHDPARLKPLANKRVIVTAGGTIEDIDPVRYISNRSSGKMGFAFAQVAQELGAEVTLIYGNVSDKPPQFYRNIKIRSALDLLKEIKKIIQNTDILIMSAAVADYRAENKANEKIKKKSKDLSITLTPNPDILKTLSKNKKKNQIFVGFALETNNIIKNAEKKLKEKNLDMIIVNTPENFNSEEGEGKIIFQDRMAEDIPLKTKSEIAFLVYQKIVNSL